MHFGVDSAVAFLALVVVGLIVGVPWGVTAVVALVIGAVACRSTRRAEARALAARVQPGGEQPAGEQPADGPPST